MSGTDVVRICAIGLRSCYGMSTTDLHACYGMSGTELAYAATRRSVLFELPGASLSRRPGET
eukprot:936754-Rhodomonas_salina.4